MSQSGKQQFIYQFEAIRPELITELDAWTEDDLRIAGEHYEYLKRATEEGIVVLAGRSLDSKGPAIVIFEAESEELAIKFRDADPFVSGGLMRAPLHPFRASLVRE